MEALPVVEERKSPSEGTRNAEQIISSAIHREQKHGVPVLLSLLVPGLGQVVKGQILKGLYIFFSPLFILIGIVLILALVSGFLVLPKDRSILSGILLGIGLLSYIVLYIWQLFDTYNSNG